MALELVVALSPLQLLGNFPGERQNAPKTIDILYDPAAHGNEHPLVTASLPYMDWDNPSARLCP